MRSGVHTLATIHRFLSQNLVYPVTFSTLLVAAIWAARSWRIGALEYGLVPYNLSLAWIPYLFSLLAALLHARFPRHWWLLAIPFAFWLIFLPNAPYTITDIMHFDNRPPVPVWYDIGLFATYAWTGCFLGVVSLNIMQAIVRDYIGRLASWVFVAGAVVLSALGIYLGRFLNWNSWDLFTQPKAIAADLSGRLSHIQFYEFTVLFAAFVLMCYVTFVSVQQRER